MKEQAFTYDKILDYHTHHIQLQFLHYKLDEFIIR